MMDDFDPPPASTRPSFPSIEIAGPEALSVLRYAMDAQLTDRANAEQTSDGELLFEDDFVQLRRDGFLFRSPGGVHFRYHLSDQVYYHVPAGLEDEAELFLWGTVFGAVSWLNDLLPLHASAVEAGGRIIAFTADSGAGKSTLAAGLAERGFRHVCDDTLVLAPSSAGLVGLPDGKPLKLWDDSLSFVSASKTSSIATVPGKNYATVGNICTQPALLRDLVFLEEGDAVSLTPIKGSEKLQLFPQAMYRNYLHTARDDADYHAQLMVMAATSVRFWCLRRPLDVTNFAGVMDAVAQALRDAGEH